MKKVIFLCIIIVIITITTSCSTKMTNEELYNQGIDCYTNLEFDKAEEIFFDLQKQKYQNSIDYYYQIINLRAVPHLNKIIKINIEEKQTIATVLLDDNSIYLFYLSGKRIDRKILISKGNN